MKERFWVAFYWLLIAYSILALFTLIFVKVNYKDVEVDGDYWKLPIAYEKIENKLLFSYINYRSIYCKTWNDRNYENASREIIKKCSLMNMKWVRSIRLNNYYPFILILFMIIIRWVSTGKHIWQRP
tara:strand:+ start:273 stop:653 length:381 start_codon:yes stop_codon:yes gene_type:complete